MDEISRNLWSTDASMYQVIPTAIVTPKSEKDVISVTKYCYENNLPLHPRGGGAGLIGASIGEGVVIDFTTHMNQMIDLNVEEMWFKVQPGRKLALIQEELASYGLFLPPDPASAEYCAIGGNIGTNAGGSHSLKYGLMADYALRFKIVLANGELIQTGPYKLDDPEYLKIKNSNTLEGKIYREIERMHFDNEQIIMSGYPEVNYNIAGYELRGLIKNGFIDLTRVFVGSEGTLGTIIEIKMKVFQKPKHSMMLIAYFKDAVSMGKATYEAVEMGSSAVEVLDYRLMEVLRTREEKLTANIPNDMEYMLGIEFDGDDVAKIEKQIDQINIRLTEEKGLAFKTEEAKTDAQLSNYWRIRKLALPLLGQINDKGRRIVPVIEDASVPQKDLAEYLNDIILVMENNGVPFAMYGHAGKGLVHIRPLIDLKKQDNIDAMVTVANASFKKARELKGTMSGEHGDGRVRSIYINELYGDEIYSLFVRLKTIFDYKKILNPEIKITQDPITANLRYDSNYEYTDDYNKGLLLHWQDNEWEHEIEMCNGCSRCTSLSNIVNMCPIFRSSKKETASPKAKANALRAVISGRVDRETALKSPIMKELIFNCTTCQSCTIDCPAAVNIPKIALEFKAEIVANEGQPVNEYLLGSIGTVGKILTPISFITNWFMNTRFSRWMAEKTVKITRHRKLPRFARKSFIKWYRKEYLPTQPLGKKDYVKKVAYFVGCTANYITPNIGKSFIQVLEANNIEVVVPDQKCSGLPMYAYGNVKRAKKNINYSIEKFMPYVEQGYDIVVTCSSCGLSLKDEWKDLLGTVETQRISEVTYHFSEYLLKLKEEGLLNENFNSVNVTLGYHMPCHLRVQGEAKYASTIMLEMVPDIKVEKIEQGCCGICGSWGYKKDNYDQSMEIGKGLFEKLKSDEIEKGVTDCPTCTLQMEHGTNKDTLHPVEILAMSYNNSE